MPLSVMPTCSVFIGKDEASPNKIIKACYSVIITPRSVIPMNEASPCIVLQVYFWGDVSFLNMTTTLHNQTPELF